MLLHLSEYAPEPLHAQISAQVGREILERRLEARRELPPVRRLASRHRISAVSVERAYRELEVHGLVRRAGGRWLVNPVSPALGRLRGVGSRVRPIGPAESFLPPEWRRDVEKTVQIQSRLTALGLPLDRRLDLAVESRPARCVSGDFVEVFPIDSDVCVVAVADVSGKSLPAALIVSSVHALLHAQNWQEADLRTIVGRLNRHLTRFTPDDQFVTLVLGIYHLSSGVFHYVNAGHNYPLVVRPGGRISELKSGGPVLGLMDGAHYETERAVLGPGELVCFYTDGVTEACNDEREEFGAHRLRSLLRRNSSRSAGAILDAVERALNRFETSPAPRDDRTLLVFKKTVDTLEDGLSPKLEGQPCC